MEGDGLAVEMVELNNICRFCANYHEYLKPIFKEANQLSYSNSNSIIDTDINVDISNIAITLLGIDINIIDELPKFICIICYDKLISSYEFRQQCLATIENLRKHVHNNKEKGKQILLGNDYEPIINILDYADKNLHDSVIKLELEQQQYENNKDNDDDDDDNNRSIDEKPCENIKELKIKNITRKKAVTAFGKKSNNILETKNTSKKNIKTPSICPVCGETRTNISAHMQRMHGIDGEGPFECDFCGKIFKGKPTLKNHFKIHLNIRKYICNLCDKAYVDSTSLRVHMLNHNDERKYKCKICDKSFRQSCALRTHMTTHTQERKFPCAFCDLRFLTCQAKGRHEILHKNIYPYKCEFCIKAFNNSSTLSQHRFNVHTKLNPYKCEICSKTFVQRADFNRHKRQHEYKII